ncbi:hypothetical protein TNCV_3864841 [Trichonephila clavipes]|nr:hypothetical protein TNCV_3864841 [Trichonephila clavipes]
MVVTQKCLGGPPVDRNRLNAHPGYQPLQTYYILRELVSLFCVHHISETQIAAMFNFNSQFLRGRHRISVNGKWNKYFNFEDNTQAQQALLRVKGIRNLRVVDASVMPIIPGGNTIVPTMMVAEKASDIIKDTISCESDNDMHFILLEDY